MAARDTLSEGMASLEAHLASADKDAQAVALQVRDSHLSAQNAMQVAYKSVEVVLLLSCH